MKLLSISLSGNYEKVHFKTSVASSDLQNELEKSEFEKKLNWEKEKCQSLENKIFSMEKQIFVLKNSQNSPESESSPKRSRIENDKKDVSSEYDIINQDIVTKYNVAMVELEELKRISKDHLLELNNLQSENKNLVEDVENKKDQVYTLIFCILHHSLASQSSD